MEEVKVLTYDEAIKRFNEAHPKGVDLVYVDYRDCISDTGTLQKMVKENTLYIDDMMIDGWYGDSVYDGAIEVMVDLFTEDEMEQLENDSNLKDDIRFYIQEHDTSDPVKDLLRNTGIQPWYYSLNLTYDGYDYTTHEERMALVQTTAKVLNLPIEKVLDTMAIVMDNAYDGGDICLLFACDVQDLICEDTNTIIFNQGAELCVMNRGNGSGHSEPLKIEIVLPLNRNNLYHDIADAGYSFTKDVCGLVLSGIEYPISLERRETMAMIGTNEALQEREEAYKKYDELIKEGKCSPSDPRYNSHDTEYINQYPCGNKCKRCSKFFID